MRVGDPVIEAGDPVHPGAIAVLAALGRSEVLVRRRPTVGIVTTGDELRPPDRYEDVRAGVGVPESNGPMIAAQVAQAGGRPRYLGISPDEPEALRTMLQAGAETDALVTVGGASMGEADLVKDVLTSLGFELDFWRVRIRPGSPFGFGWIPRGETRVPVFSLPGNPASAFVTFEVFVRPYLLAVAGHRRLRRRTLPCVAGEDLLGPAGLTYFLRVEIDSRRDPPVATLCGPQGSGLVRSLARAQGLAVVPEGGNGVGRGDKVEVLVLDDSPPALEAPAGR
jgi:molybdopterin molybdotransferase